MNCPSCGAPMRLTSGNVSMRCVYCKSIFVPAADDTGVAYLDEVPELACPACSVPLWDATLAGIAIHACKQCHGLLVAMGVIEALIDQVRAENRSGPIPPQSDPADLKRIVNCPRCHQHMDTHYYYGGGHTILSGCERCSLNWLDGGVLMRIVRTADGFSAETKY